LYNAVIKTQANAKGTCTIFVWGFGGWTLSSTPVPLWLPSSWGSECHCGFVGFMALSANQPRCTQKGVIGKWTKLFLAIDTSLTIKCSMYACPGDHTYMSFIVFVNWLFTVALPFICDFETDAICDMQLSTASNLDWTRRIGRASEQNTGPAGAQSGSYYMLVDESQDHQLEHSPAATTCSSTRQWAQMQDTELCQCRQYDNELIHWHFIDVVIIYTLPPCRTSR